eukprot:m.151755 g.151755  ORF g.151755 m.151755 type:complete len:198 (-) comp14257_c0_seq6:453-1046(-)
MHTQSSALAQNYFCTSTIQRTLVSFLTSSCASLTPASPLCAIQSIPFLSCSHTHSHIHFFLAHVCVIHHTYSLNPCLFTSHTAWCFFRPSLRLSPHQASCPLANSALMSVLTSSQAREKQFRSFKPRWFKSQRQIIFAMHATCCTGGGMGAIVCDSTNTQNECIHLSRSLAPSPFYDKPFQWNIETALLPWLIHFDD